MMDADGLCEPGTRRAGRGTLVFFCGKMGAGKTTLSRRIAEETRAVLISEDEWLSQLYPDEIRSFEDYRKYAPRLKAVLEHHVSQLLEAGIPVVMDFPGNTRNQRAWFSRLVSRRGGFPHRLIYLDTDDDTCLKQIALRRSACPERAIFDTPEVFHKVTSFFEAPLPDEGFEIEIVRPEAAG